MDKSQLSIIVLYIAAAACLVTGIFTFAGKGTLAKENGGRAGRLYYGAVFTLLGVAFAGIASGMVFGNGWLRLLSIGAGMVVGVLALLRKHFFEKKREE